MKLQTMNRSLTLAASLVVVAFGIAVTSTNARPNKGRPAAAKHARDAGHGFKLGRGLAPEIKAQREKFRIWREDIRGGRKFFADGDKAVRKAYAGLNHKIVKLMVDDRVSDSDGFALLGRVESVGKNALEITKREPLTAGQKSEVLDQLDEVQRYLSDKTKPLPESDERTPNLNRFQIEAREITRFGKDSGVLSDGKVNTLSRKIDTLQRHEEKVKSDGELSDREREKLFEEAIKLGRTIIKEFTD